VLWVFCRVEKLVRNAHEEEVAVALSEATIAISFIDTYWITRIHIFLVVYLAKI
jgi:hypothetical protein